MVRDHGTHFVDKDRLFTLIRQHGKSDAAIGAELMDECNQDDPLPLTGHGVYFAGDDYTAKKRKAEAELTEIKLMRQRAELIPVADLRDTAEQIGGALTRVLESIVPQAHTLYEIAKSGDFGPFRRAILALQTELRIRAAAEMEKLAGLAGPPPSDT